MIEVRTAYWSPVEECVVFSSIWEPSYGRTTTRSIARFSGEDALDNALALAERTASQRPHLDEVFVVMNVRGPHPVDAEAR